MAQNWVPAVVPGSTLDHVVFFADDGTAYRAFVCHTLNAWGYPAKDRSGRLDPIEEPHLGRLMEKIAGPARPATERLDFARPAPAAIPESTSTQES